MESTKIFEVQASSVKDLKQQISDLRDEIVRLKSAGQDYSKEADQLRKSQQMLNDVMGLSKKEAVALDGSYDALVYKMSQLKKAWRATNDEAERNAIGGQIKAINDQLKDMDASIGNFQRNVGNYSSVWDDLDKVFGSIRQSGGDLAGGIQALAQGFGMATSKSDGFNKGMNGLKTVLGSMQGAKGFAGLIKSIGSFITKLNASKVATNQLTVATNLEKTAHVTNTVAKGAETTATWTLKGAIDALKATVTGGASLIMTAITTVIGLLPSLIDMFKKTGDEAEETANKIAGMSASLDDLQGYFDELFHDEELEIELMKKRGDKIEDIREAELELYKKKQDWYGQQAINKQKELADAQRELDSLEEGTEAWNLMDEKVKELTSDIHEANKQAMSFGQKVVDLPKIWQAEDAGSKNKGGGGGAVKNMTETLRKASEKAKEETDKILDSTLSATEKSIKAYDILKAKIEENYQAEVSGATVTGERIEDIDARYKQARIIAEQNYWKERFDIEYEEQQKSLNLLDAEKEETLGLYHELISVAKGTASATAEYNAEIRSDNLQTANDGVRAVFEALKAIKPEYEGIIDELSQYPHDTMIAIAQNLGNDEALKAIVGEDMAKTLMEEPFKTALEETVPRIENYLKTRNENLKQFVLDTMNEIDDAIKNLKPDEANNLFVKLLENPPVASNPELRQAMEAYVRNARRALGEAIVNSNELSQGEKTNYLVELFGGSEAIPVDLKLRPVIDQINQYREATVSALDAVAGAWQSVITAQQENLKYQLDSGKISEQEFNERAKRMDERNEKAFNAMKGLQYATATINTAGAVVQALTDPAVPTYYLRAINAAAALATGIAEVAQISATHYNRMGSVSAPTLASTPVTVQTTGLSNYAEAIGGQTLNVNVGIVDSELKAGLEHYDQKIAETTF